MPSIIEVMEITDPEEGLSWERREFVSPNGKWIASYQNPREWHIGVSGWLVSLREASGAVDRTPRALRSMSVGEGLLCPSDFLPWRFDSQVLAILPWHRTPRLLDVESGKLALCEVTGTPLTAQWAATKPYLLAVYFDRINVLDGEGRTVSTMGWEAADDEIPYTGWTHRDALFFVIRHSPRRTKTRVTFVDPENSSAPRQTLELDPARLVPYDDTRFKRVSRDGLSLRIGEWHHATRHLLDTWQKIRFDPNRNVLMLSVYRPIGDPFKPDPRQARRANWVCNAKERWVAVRLNT